MKFRCFKNVYHIAFHTEVLSVLIAMLPMGVFAASTMNSGRWVPPRTSIKFVSPVATAANETGPSKKVAFRPDGWSICPRFYASVSSIRRVLLNTDHNVRCLDNNDSCTANCQVEVLNGFVRD